MPGPPSWMNLRADREGFFLERLLRLDGAQAAGDHDRLVVAAHRAGDILLIGAEVAGQVRAAEFVVEGGRANRAFEHDVERRGDARRAAVGVFPRLRRIRQIEVGDRETAEAGLRLGTLAGGAFVADFATGTGGGTGERRNRGRVVVRLDLGQDVGQLFLVAVATVGIRVETLDGGAFDDRGVVGVGHDRALRGGRMRFADHAEQRFILGFAVDHPGSVENLVAAVFGIGLGEHHQLDVSRVAAGLAEDVEQVIDFVFGERQPQRAVGVDQRGFATLQHVDRSQRLRREMAEQFARFGKAGEHRFGHAVVQQAGDGLPLIDCQGAIVLGGDMEGNDALDALDGIQIAVPGNVGGLGRPR